MNKEKKIGYLMDEIGRINDMYVAEAAESAKATQGSSKLWFKYLGVAACLVLAVAIVLRVGVLIGDFSEKSDFPTEQGPMDPHSVGLDVYLAESDFPNVTVLGGMDHAGGASELLNFSDGNAYLVWQEEGSDTLSRSRPLAKREVESLKKEIVKGVSLNSADTEPPRCYVWLVLGDGKVLSPYLEQTPGNVGYGTLFDYDPECIPTPAFITLVSDILEGR